MTDLIIFLAQIKELAPQDDDFFTKTGTQQLQDFAQGKLAMIIAPSQAIFWLRGQSPDFEFGITVIPEATMPGKNNLGLSGLYAGICASCVNADAAWLFLSFLDEKSSSFVTKAVPGRFHGMFAAQRPADIYKDPLYEKAWDIFESSGIAETLFTFPLADELEIAVREELLDCFSGKSSPSAAADSIQKRWLLVLEKH